MTQGTPPLPACVQFCLSALLSSHLPNEMMLLQAAALHTSRAGEWCPWCTCCHRSPGHCWKRYWRPHWRDSPSAWVGGWLGDWPREWMADCGGIPWMEYFGFAFAEVPYEACVSVGLRLPLAPIHQFVSYGSVPAPPSLVVCRPAPQSTWVVFTFHLRPLLPTAAFIPTHSFLRTVGHTRVLQASASAAAAPPTSAKSPCRCATGCSASRLCHHCGAS